MVYYCFMLKRPTAAGTDPLLQEDREDLRELPQELRGLLRKGLVRETDPAQLIRTAAGLAGKRNRRTCIEAFAFLPELPPGPLRRWWLRAVYDLPDRTSLLRTVVAGFVSAGAQGPALGFCRKASQVGRRLGHCGPALLRLTAPLARLDPPAALEIFLAGPESVSGLSPVEKILIFDQARKLDRTDQTEAFLASAPQVLDQAGRRGLVRWLNMALEEKPSARGGFLSLASRASLEALDRIAGGLSLDSARRVLEFYAGSITAKQVALAPLSQAPEEVFPSALAPGAVSQEPEAVRIFLPARERSAAPMDTYRARLALLLTAEGCGWDFLLTFPDPWLASDLWTLAAEIRAREELSRKWPGLRGPLALLDRVRREGLSNHPLALNPILKAVARRVWGGRIRVGPGTGLERDEAELARKIQTLLLSGPDPAEAVDQAYFLLTTPRAGPGFDPAPSLPRTKFGSLEARRPFESSPGLKAGAMDTHPTLSRRGERAGYLDNLSRLTEKLRRLEENGPDRRETGSFFYPEWDPELGGYRPGWVRVVERTFDRTGAEREPPAIHPAVIRNIRRQFQRLRPRGMKSLKTQSDGAEIDLDAAVGWAVDRLRGYGREGKVYLDRRLKKRDVACAVLIDLSGSTGRRLGPQGRTVLDVAKEGLFVLAEALSVLGDPFALFGFSGSGRTEVTFSIIKDFGEDWNREVKAGLAGLDPGRQNRDGAALRHAAFRLASHPARQKILFHISDGRPDDYGYSGTRALEDTKAALKEAGQRGIRSFGLTIDRAAREYVAEMMGSTPNIILDRVEKLPLLLPRLYWRIAR